jgi:murein DD-endopeptidase MepM/ murein hydrolase activator NlpD
MSGIAHASRTAHPSTHKVRRGETAARIARENGLTLAQLEAINPKINMDRLAAGTVVKVRGPVPAAPVRRGDLHPVAPLPATPAPGPTAFTHMERILPAQVRDLSALDEAHNTYAALKPVLPPAEPVAEAPAAPTFEPADPSHLDLLWPVETRTVSSGWGPRMRSKTIRVKAAKRRVRYRGSHKGVDLTAPKGTDVFAALDGKVVVAGKDRGYGNYVMLDHGNGVVTLYGHHNRNFVVSGEIVHRGQKIAEVGRTGNATGPHLHFELRVDGAVQNPLPFLNEVEEIPADQIALNQAATAPRTRR